MAATALDRAFHDADRWFGRRLGAALGRATSDRFCYYRLVFTNVWGCLMVACRWRPVMVTLADGRAVESDHPAWLAEAEARTVLGMLHGRRRQFLALVAERRGPAAVDRLKALMREVEPRFVLDLPNVDVRRAYLGRVEEFEGSNARTYLEGRIRVLWREMLAAQKGAGAKSPGPEEAQS